MGAARIPRVAGTQEGRDPRVGMDPQGGRDPLGEGWGAEAPGQKGPRVAGTLGQQGTHGWQEGPCRVGTHGKKDPWGAGTPWAWDPGV